MRQRVGVISVGVQHFRYAFGHAGALPLGPQPISQKRQRTTDNGINAAGPITSFAGTPPMASRSTIKALTAIGENTVIGDFYRELV
jgi:hypothetical protein